MNVTEKSHYVSPQTAGALIVFLVLYVYFLLRRAAESKLELFDFIVLSAVGVVPVAFAFMPDFFLWLTNFLGVGFPFVLLFGGLFFIVFIFMFLTTRRLILIERKLIQLTQNVAIKLMEQKQQSNSSSEH